MIGSMYRPPNVDTDQFSQNLAKIVNKVRSSQSKTSPEIILGMDHNMNLLKGSTHIPTQRFIDCISDLGLNPTITRPTRITHQTATLIDNILISEDLHRNFESTILLEDISDHLPTLTMLKQTRLLKREPLTFESRCLNEGKLRTVNTRLMQVDWIGVLTGMTSDKKFSQFSHKLEDVLNDVAPLKSVRISTKWRFIEPWMTKGIDQASRKKIKLYKKTLSTTCTQDDLKRYKEYRNIFNTLKLKTRREYYQAKCIAYKHNIKKLWDVINNTITRVKHKGSIIPFITVNGIQQHNPKDIANSFGEFYANLGKT